MLQVIFARVLSGIAGAGVGVLTSLIITDLVPPRDVAVWRSYVNVASTLGRSVGAPVGGWLVDAIGWRWSFIGQGPLFASAALLVWISFPHHAARQQRQQEQPELTTLKKLARIDCLGSLMLALSVISILLPLEVGGVNLPWTHPVNIGLMISPPFFIAPFVYVDLKIFSDRNVVKCFQIISLQIGAQVGVSSNAHKRDPISEMHVR